MTRLGLLLSTLAACASAAPEGTATFHGTVGTVVTHVMAVSPVAGDLKKILVPTENGAFSIDVEPGRPWALVFVDSTRVGSAMVAGVLRADTLDTFLPETAGDIDLGHISIDNREATMAGSSDDLGVALGVSRRTLATLGGLDDIALRYANPDVDGDGVIDLEEGQSALLELHAEYALTVPGRAATADDFVARAPDISFDHLGTGIYGRLPDGVAALDPDRAYVAFEQPYWGFEAGPSTPPVNAGQPVTDLTFGTDGRTFGVFARPDHAIPSGDYRFVSGHETLSFTLVRPPTSMLMNQVMPRVHFVPVVEDCKHACAVSAIEFAWQRRTDLGWITLTDEEAHALQPAASIDVQSVFGHRHYELPVGYPSGSMPWQQDLYRQGDVTTADITYVNIGFQLRPGMKMYASLGDGDASAHQVGVADISRELAR